MNKVEQYNQAILEKFNLKLVKQTDTWVEYTDGLKVLFVDKGCFHYYFKSSDSAVPITPDIVMLVNIIRKIILKVEPEYTIFKDAYNKAKNLDIFKEDFNIGEY